MRQSTPVKHSTINIGLFAISAIYKFVKISTILAENLLKLNELGLGSDGNRKIAQCYEVDELKSNQRCKGHKKCLVRVLVDLS